MSANILLLISLLSILPWSGGARADAPAPDFSAGFAKLVELGMPQLDAEAVWVTSREATPYWQREGLKSFKGSAWLVGKGKDARLVAMGGLELMDWKPSSKRPDLDQDIEALMTAIRKASEKVDRDSGGGLISPYGNAMQEAAALVMFGAQLHQTGRTEQANRLVAAVFATLPEREPIIDAAVNTMAEQRYDKLCDEFFEKHDWAAYHAGLVDLTTRFPRGWEALEAVRVFLPQVAKQAQGLTPPTPALPEIEIDPRALAAVAALGEKPAAQDASNSLMITRRGMIDERMYYESLSNYQYHRMGGNVNCWLLDDPVEAGKRNATDATARIKALGVAALPVLVALLGDPFLLARPAGQTDGRDFRSSDDGGLVQLYNRMRRPAARGEIARRLLLGALPDPDQELASIDDKELAAQALDFWRAHRSSSREDLALVFFRGGGRYQVTTAAAVLAKASDPKFHAALEEYFLAQDPAYESYDLVKAYLQARKQAARPFYQKFSELVSSQAGGDIDDPSALSDASDYRVREFGSVGKLLKSLAPLVNDKEPRALAVEIAKGDPKEAEAAIRELDQALTGVAHLKQLHAYLEGANAAQDGGVRVLFLSSAFGINWPGREDAELSEPRRKLSAAEERVWRILMADKRELKDFPLANKQRMGFPVQTAADWACAAFEHSISYEGIWRFPIAGQYMDRKAVELLRETVNARLDGKPLPVLPDPKKVPRERLEELIAETGKLQPAAILAFLKTLGMDERAAWGDWFKDPDDDAPKPPESVEALKSFVHTRGTPDIDDDLPPSTRVIATFEPGFVLTPEWLQARIKLMTEQPADFSPYVLTFEASDIGLEVTEHLRRPDPPKQPPVNSDAPDTGEEVGNDFWSYYLEVAGMVLKRSADATMAIVLNNGQDHGFLLVTKDRQIAVPGDEGELVIDDAQVAEVIGNSLADNDQGYFTVISLTRADLAALKLLNPDDDEDEEEMSDEDDSQTPAPAILPPVE